MPPAQGASSPSGNGLSVGLLTAPALFQDAINHLELLPDELAGRLRDVFTPAPVSTTAAPNWVERNLRCVPARTPTRRGQQDASRRWHSASAGAPGTHALPS
jgi:hypothetical protein